MGIGDAKNVLKAIDDRRILARREALTAARAAATGDENSRRRSLESEGEQKAFQEVLLILDSKLSHYEYSREYDNIFGSIHAHKRTP